MKKFLTRILITAILVPVAIVLILNALPKDDRSFFYVYTQKCNLLKTVEEPRMIFVGSSSIAFGLDSKRLQDSLHVNVINTAITSGIGFRYMVDDIVDYVREGDIVVFAPIYIQFYGGADGASSGELTKIIDYTDWKNLKKLNFAQLKNVFIGMPADVRSRIDCVFPKKNLKEKNSCCLEGYNEFGDEVYHWELPSKPMSKIKPITKPFDSEFAEHFAEVLKELNQKATVVLLPPPIVETGFASLEKQAYQLSDFLSSHGFPYIADPRHFVQSDDCYYDGFYHMTKKGVDIYNTKLIEGLRPIVEKHLTSK